MTVRLQSTFLKTEITMLKGIFSKIFWIHLRTECKLRLDAEFISIYFLDFAGYYRNYVVLLVCKNRMKG